MRYNAERHPSHGGAMARAFAHVPPIVLLVGALGSLGVAACGGDSSSSDGAAAIEGDGAPPGDGSVGDGLASGDTGVDGTVEDATEEFKSFAPLRDGSDPAAEGGGDGGVEAALDASGSANGDAEAGGDAGADAGVDSGDAGPPRTTESVLLQLRGDSCLGCAADAGCLAAGSTCEDFNDAGDGGDGAAAREACLDTLTCVLQTGCASTGAVGVCYCGDSGAAGCNGGTANGACRGLEERTLGTTSPAVILKTYLDGGTPGGRANAVVQCASDSFCIDCP